MPESLKQLQDRLENYVEKIKTRRGEIQDVSSQYNFDINRTYSFNLALFRLSTAYFLLVLALLFSNGKSEKSLN